MKGRHKCITHVYALLLFLYRINRLYPKGIEIEKTTTFFNSEKGTFNHFFGGRMGGGVMLLDGVCVWYNIMNYCLPCSYFVIRKWWMFLSLLINNIYLKHENLFCCSISRKRV